VIRTKKNENQFLPKENNTNENQLEALERPKDTKDSRKFNWKKAKQIEAQEPRKNSRKTRGQPWCRRGTNTLQHW